MAINKINQFIAYDAAAVTPSDTLPNSFAYFYVGTGGNIALVTEAGNSVTLYGVPSGSYVWVRANKVMNTNTTASQITGFH